MQLATHWCPAASSTSPIAFSSLSFQHHLTVHRCFIPFLCQLSFGLRLIKVWQWSLMPSICKQRLLNRRRTTPHCGTPAKLLDMFRITLRRSPSTSTTTTIPESRGESGSVQVGSPVGSHTDALPESCSSNAQPRIDGDAKYAPEPVSSEGFSYFCSSLPFGKMHLLAPDQRWLCVSPSCHRPFSTFVYLVQMIDAATVRVESTHASPVHETFIC